jgi:hypothetical protein
MLALDMLSWNSETGNQMNFRNLLSAVCLAAFLAQVTFAQSKAPDGFEPLFDGKSLEGWFAMPTEDPRNFEALSAEEQATKISALEKETGKFWRVEDGQVINDGDGPYLTSKRHFRDFELLIDFKLESGGDSGVYLKATPQVQVWDTTHEPSFKNGAEKGSGGLWNNAKGSPARFPTENADKPVGEWNTMRVLQIGARTSVWLNDKKIVHHQIMDNYWARQLPLIASGPIQLQTHGGKMYSDFAVRFEFKLPPSGNNGLAIRYPGSGDTAYVGMCELQVLDNSSANYAKLDPRQYHGSAYGIAPAARGYQRPVGEWNFQEVTVVGSTIKVELNGNLILNTDLSKISDYLADKPHPGKDRTSGHFGFAGHSDPVEFRNIFIKDLSSEKAANE